jgi:hypothetical protein
MSDRVFVTAGDWAVGTDGMQWILMQPRQEARGGWRALWFVRSDRDILERGMRQKGVEPADMRLLLAGLPDTFDEWKSAHGQVAGQEAGVAVG